MSLSVYLSIKYTILKGFTDESLLKYIVQDTALDGIKTYLN